MNSFYFIIILFFLIALCIFIAIRKNFFSIKNSFVLFILYFVLLGCVVFSNNLSNIVNMINLDLSTAYLAIAMSILFIFCLFYLKRLDDLQKKVMDLAQELSIVKEEIKKHNC